MHTGKPLLYQFIYNFIVIALSEENFKFLTFKRVLVKNDYPCSWLDISVLMTITGIGFGLIESVVYAIDASVPVVLVRGLCLAHAGYGFVTGYFYGKGLKTDKNFDKWFGFILSCILHGLYDFSLSKEYVEINENLMFVALGLAVLGILLVINLIVFVRKRKQDEFYIQPIADIKGQSPL